MASSGGSPKRKRKSDKAIASSSSSSTVDKRRPSSTPARDGRASATMMPIRVEVAPNDPERDPVVVSFPRGIPISIAGIEGGKGGGGPPPPRFERSKLKPSSSRGTRIRGEDEHCSYAASASGRGHDGRLTKAYVCVFDRRAGTLKLVPGAERGTIFALEQRAREYNPKGLAAAQVGTAAGPISVSDQMQMLVDSFGSRKKQKVMNSRASNKVDVNNVVGSGDVMMRSITEQEGISRDNRRMILEEGDKKVNHMDVAYEQARRRMLPHYDADADSPSKVYNAQSIADVVAWERVSRIVDKILEKREAPGGEPDWIGALLGKKEHRPQSLTTLLESIDPAKKGSKYRIKVAFLLFFALKLHTKIQRSRGGTIEGGSLDDCVGKLFVPHEIGMRLFELFMSAKEGGEGVDGYVASQQQKTKLTAHIMVLYAIASGKEMMVPSVNQLCRDMKLDAKDASLVLREAGFTVKKNAAGDVGASLSVPLKFPPPKRVKRS